MLAKATTEPRVYVGTYAKYNDGNITGAWITLSDYSDHDAFIEACHELHKDEEDPELMFQDYEGFPACYYGESSISEDLWENWIDLDDDDRELLEAYASNFSDPQTIDDAREAFMGKADTRADFAYNWYEETGELDKVPEALRCHIDWDSVARDMSCGDIFFVRHNGDVYAFSNI